MVEKMRNIILLVVFVLCTNLGFSQTYTFSNTTANTHDTWNSSNNWATPLSKTIVVSGVPTSGQVLRQINLNLGSATSSNISTLQARLRDPAGNTVNIIGSGYFYNTDFSKFVTISLRDHAKLKRLSDYTNSYLGMPYNHGYYRVETAGSFANFNTTTNVNGNWVLEIIENTGVEIAFISVDLIFGPPFTYVDITGTSSNNNCAGAQCLQSANNEILIGTNNGYPQNQAIYPPLNISGCNWNAEKNNTSWFFFQPTSTNVNISASGFNNNEQQTVVFKIDGNCGSPTYNLIACPTSMFVGGCVTTTGNQFLYHRDCYDGGQKFNHEYNLTGLTIGDNYLFIIDGLSGANSDFYIELGSGADDGCRGPLPVKLSNFEVSCQSNLPELKWSTSTEINNDYFTVERAVGLADEKELHFIEIAKIQGSGNSNIEQNYHFKDDSYLNNKSGNKTYYRLKQTDYDGQFEYFYPLLANCNVDQNEINIYPNPNEGKFSISGVKKGDVVNVYSQLGMPFLNSKVSEDGLFDVDISSLAKGIYFVKVQNKLSTYSTKVQVN
jgi:hypothetical protein